MDGGWWEPDISLLEWEVTDKAEVEARMIDLHCSHSISVSMLRANTLN